MGGCKTRGTCKLGILSYIREDTIIQNIDWCRYLLACMKSCKSGWKRDDARTYFAGPIALLTLIYVDATTCDKLNVPRRRPVMRSWSYEFLKQREDAEIEDGGFGLGDVLPVYETTSTDEVDLSDEEHRNKGDFYVSTPTDVKGYAFKMEMLYNRIVNDSTNLKSTVSDALAKFPVDVHIEEWHDKILKILEKTTNIGEDDGKQPKDEGLTKDIVVDTTEKSFQTPLPSKVQELEMNEDEQLSQFWRDPEVLQQVERSFEGIDKRPDISNVPYMQDSSVPGFSLGLTQEFENAASEADVLPQDMRNQEVSVIVKSKKVTKATNSISEIRQNRGNRVKKASNAGRSPFFQRIVELREHMTRLESNVWKYIRSQTGIFSEIMFATVDGHETIQDTIETILPKSMINAHIIDCWAVLLNIEEGKRSNNTVARLFFHTGMMKEDMLKGTMDDEVVLDMFVSNVDEVLKGYQTLTTLKDCDLVFFPIVQDAHFYLICFNMKSVAFVVIDNVYDRIQFKKKYEGVPEKVQEVFAAYLKLVGHTKADRILKANPVRLQMKWRTVKNVWDYGIFVMRHMETYKGEAVSKWDCDLDVEGAKQTRRLTRLKKKYTTKILLSEHNVHRDKVVNYANAYIEQIKNLKLAQQNGDSLLENNLQS